MKLKPSNIYLEGIDLSLLPMSPLISKDIFDGLMEGMNKYLNGN